MAQTPQDRASSATPRGVTVQEVASFNGDVDLDAHQFDMTLTQGGRTQRYRVTGQFNPTDNFFTPRSMQPLDAAGKPKGEAIDIGRLNPMPTHSVGHEGWRMLDGMEALSNYLNRQDMANRIQGQMQPGDASAGMTSSDAARAAVIGGAAFTADDLDRQKTQRLANAAVEGTLNPGSATASRAGQSRVASQVTAAVGHAPVGMGTYAQKLLQRDYNAAADILDQLNTKVRDSQTHQINAQASANMRSGNTAKLDQALDNPKLNAAIKNGDQVALGIVTNIAAGAPVPREAQQYFSRLNPDNPRAFKPHGISDEDYWKIAVQGGINQQSAERAMGQNNHNAARTGNNRGTARADGIANHPIIQHLARTNPEGARILVALEILGQENLARNNGQHREAAGAPHPGTTGAEVRKTLNSPDHAHLTVSVEEGKTVVAVPQSAWKVTDVRAQRNKETGEYELLVDRKIDTGKDPANSVGIRTHTRREVIAKLTPKEMENLVVSLPEGQQGQVRVHFDRSTGGNANLTVRSEQPLTVVAANPAHAGRIAAEGAATMAEPVVHGRARPNGRAATGAATGANGDKVALSTHPDAQQELRASADRLKPSQFSVAGVQTFTGPSSIPNAGQAAAGPSV